MSNVLVTPNKSAKPSREMSFFNKPFSWIHWGATGSFLVVKGGLRPLVLESDPAGWLKIFVLSYPNFCEAIVGSFLLVNGLDYINNRYVKDRYRLKTRAIILIGILLAAIYVITQELKIHNLGGQNVFDPYDVLFSVIGLFISYSLFVYIIPLEIAQKEPNKCEN